MESVLQQKGALEKMAEISLPVIPFFFSKSGSNNFLPKIFKAFLDAFVSALKITVTEPLPRHLL